MQTSEHTEVGNAIYFKQVENNPYLRVDEKGILHLRLQRLAESKIPQPMQLCMTSGEMIAMMGDFFTEADWSFDLNLPDCHQFAENFADKGSIGDYLINKKIKSKELKALLKAYNNLAAPDVKRSDINTIYKIDNSHYIPFSASLNDYAKQLMFYIRVKDYGEMLERNQTHFTPWSVRVYILGHHLALRYARLSYELAQLANDPDYETDNREMIKLLASLQCKENYRDLLQDLADRYHALALQTELFTFHYYTDHFASGHMSMVGDLRLKLKQRFGIWGSILVNNLHNELNRVGVYTHKSYDPTPDSNEPSIPARGDGEVDTCINYFNKERCLAGMHCSLEDINQVLIGKQAPQQQHYGGLEYIPDVNYNSRQPQPLIVLSNDKIYCRRHPSKIKIISPTDYEKLRAKPAEHGYYELTQIGAIKLVAKLRLLPFAYDGKVQALTPLQQDLIKQDEQQRNPAQEPVPEPPCASSSNSGTIFDWREAASSSEVMAGLSRSGLLSSRSSSATVYGSDCEEDEEDELTMSC